MCVAKSDVRFTPHSDRESEFPQEAMSALPPKADMCGALGHVRFGPIADILMQSDFLFGTALLGRTSNKPSVPSTWDIRRAGAIRRLFDLLKPNLGFTI